MKEYTRVCATGLGIPEEWTSEEHPEQTFCAFSDGRMVSTYRAIPYVVYLNGAEAPAAGIADVGTLPQYRRQGFARKVVSHHFQQMREKKEQSIAILWPSRGGIYRRYGYDFVTMQVKYRIDPTNIHFTDPSPPAGAFTEIREENIATLSEIYHSFASERNGYLRRPSEWWHAHALKRAKSSLITGALYSEGNKPRGYVFYTVETVREGTFHHEHRVTVEEITYLDMRAFRATWNYLAGMDLTSTIILPSVSTDDPLPYLLVEPRGIIRQETESSTTSLMGRIIDVERAMSQRGYNCDGRLIFEVNDEMCPWNQGRWEMDISGGAAGLKRTKKTPQVTMNIDTLTALLFNYMSASFAARIGRIDITNPDALPVWDTVMNTAYKPFCPDHF